MGAFGKIVLTIIVIVAIVFGVRSYRQKAQTQQGASSEAVPTLSTGSTNQDLDKDLDTIDAQLDIINQSGAEIDTSLGSK